MSFRILILGGYGSFGAHISRRIAAWPDVELVVGGRDAARGVAFVTSLPSRTASQPLAATLDVQAADFAQQLAMLAPSLVIHTAGPFQTQDYRVAHAAIACGAHYVDLADAREFVVGFEAALDAAARAANVLCVTGASSVPGLSAAVIDQCATQLAHIDSIEIGISPGNRAERGLATVRAILGYVGRAYPVWRDGRWQQTHGWSTLRRTRFPEPVGVRWLSDCEVPDLALFPERYRGVQRVEFRAGLELRSLHFGLLLGAWLRRIGLVRDWSRHATTLHRMAEWTRALGHDHGAMQVAVQGRDADDRAQTMIWNLVATDGSGPQVPCNAAVVLADQLRRGQRGERGARACLDLFTLAEFTCALSAWPIATTLTTHEP